MSGILQQHPPVIMPDPNQPRELTEYEKALIVADEYDNEWIKFMSKLAENKSLQDIVDYIEAVYLTDRQKKTIMAYARVILGRGLSTTYFRNNLDYRMFYDDKALIDCDLTIGMTRFDITPEFNILLGLINYHVGIESRKSIGALFLKRIGTQRHEIEHSETMRDKEQGLKDKISNKLGFGD